MKVINSRIHAIIDYILIAFLWISPILFDFSESVTTFVYVLGFIHLLLTLMTHFEGGIVKVLPLPAHGLIELVVAIFLIASPWIFGVSDHATDRGFLMVFALAVLLVWFLTDYRRKKTVPLNTVKQTSSHDQSRKER